MMDEQGKHFPICHVIAGLHHGPICSRCEILQNAGLKKVPTRRLYDELQLQICIF